MVDGWWDVAMRNVEMRGRMLNRMNVESNVASDEWWSSEPDVDPNVELICIEFTTIPRTRGSSQNDDPALAVDRSICSFSIPRVYCTQCKHAFGAGCGKPGVGTGCGKPDVGRRAWEAVCGKPCVGTGCGNRMWGPDVGTGFVDRI